MQLKPHAVVHLGFGGIKLTCLMLQVQLVRLQRYCCTCQHFCDTRYTCLLISEMYRMFRLVVFHFHKVTVQQHIIHPDLTLCIKQGRIL